MNQSLKWDERYGTSEFAYGKEPNEFFKEWLLKLDAGKILMPADGEGRNGVFAATKKWRVTSCDLSKEGKSKCALLAKEQKVVLNYIVSDIDKLCFEKESFDAIGMIYAHFPADKKNNYHNRLKEYLKPGGTIIFEAFSKKNLELKKQNPKVGGPDDYDMLYSTEEIKTDFQNFEILYLEEMEIELNEGLYHNGKGSVIRFIGRKK